jgi:hypothetical protein
LIAHKNDGPEPELGCPSKLVSIRNYRNWNQNKFRHYQKQNVCFGCFGSIPKQRISVFQLNRNKQKSNRNKQKSNRNSVKERIFWYFFKKFRVVSVCFGCFGSVPKQRVSMFRLNRNKQKANRNSLIESIFWYFSENLGLFRFASKQFCLFQLFRYRFETPKQTDFFGFTKQTEIQPKQILFLFVSVRTEFFVCLEDTLTEPFSLFSIALTAILLLGSSISYLYSCL